MGEKVLKILHEAYGDRMTPAPGLGKLVEEKRLGKKTNKGIYIYEADGKRKFDPSVYQLFGITPDDSKATDEEIVERCILPMINEAIRCLDDKIVETPADVDLGMIMGTGFPPFRGGLMRYADSLGPRRIQERLQIYAKRVGPRFTPCEGLSRRAEANESLYKD